MLTTYLEVGIDSEVLKLAARSSQGSCYEEGPTFQMSYVLKQPIYSKTKRVPSLVGCPWRLRIDSEVTPGSCDHLPQDTPGHKSRCLA